MKRKSLQSGLRKATKKQKIFSHARTSVSWFPLRKNMSVEVRTSRSLTSYKKETWVFSRRLINSNGQKDINFQHMLRGGSGRRLLARLRTSLELSVFRCTWWKQSRNTSRWCAD